MELRARFAPSPTGQVHIGNIRTAIFNWLYTRHCKGRFLLRIEDTDLQRSTKEAIDTLLDCMKWLGLDYDEEAVYQTACVETHRKAALELLEKGMAYKLDPAQESSPTVFRIPYDCDGLPFIKETGAVEIELEPGSEVSIGRGGLSWLLKGPKGKPVEASGCLAGFKDLEILDASGAAVFRLEGRFGDFAAATPLKVPNCAKMRFIRREVFFNDMVKGLLSKPLDSMKDLIIVRSDGSPVFHLANVCDDVHQRITHIVRGDDHVENTYRHIFLFHALGFQPPSYAHLPMIVNASGKPYSKRDGDAFVGDFREKGFLPEALFNYLSLLGWSPGDDREKLSKDELVSLFTMERVKSSPAQFDINKLTNMNALYMAAMEPCAFAGAAWEFAARWDWRAKADKDFFSKVAALMQSRTKTFADVGAWGYFFDDGFAYDQKALKKFLSDSVARQAVEEVSAKLRMSPAADVKDIEGSIRAVEAAHGIAQGKLNQPLRVAITGTTVGAGVYETVALLGAGKAAERISKALSMQVQQ